jgi:hypothetical protein
MRWTEQAVLLFSIGLTLLFVLSINYWSVDFPNSDDYSAIVQPVLESASAPTIAAAIDPIFEPHTQHYQVLLRAAAWSSTVLTGELHFRLLVFLGSLFIFPLILAFCLTGERNRPLIALLSALLLCQPQYAEATQWATNAIPYLWVNAFALLAFVISLRAERSLFFFGVTAALLALLSWGNGILVAVELLMVHLFLRPARALPFFLIAGAGVFLHVSNPNTAGLSGATLTHAQDIIVYGIRVLGSAVGFLSADISLFFGLGVLSLWATLLILEFRKRRWESLAEPLFLFELFIVSSCLLCGLARFLEGAETAYTTGRYTLPSILFVTCLAIRSVRACPKSVLAVPVVTTALAFVWWGHAYSAYYANYIVRAELLQDSRARWACFGDGLAGLGWKDLPPLHRAAEQAGVLARVPASECTTRVVSAQQSSEPSGSSEVTVKQLDYLLRNERLLHVSGYAFRPQDTVWDGQYALILKNEKQRLVAALESRTRPDVHYHVTLRRQQIKPAASDYRQSGFAGFVDLRGLAPGRYDAFLQLRNNGHTSWSKLDTAIEVDQSLATTGAAD